MKRVWLPNVQRKALWSDALNRSISLRVSTTALRQMDRMGASRAEGTATNIRFTWPHPHPHPPGGLDEYVLGTSPTKLASEKGESLRAQMTLALGIATRATSVPSPRARLAKLAAEAKRAPRSEPATQLR